MTTVEGKLTSWHRLYVRLQDARARLEQSQSAERADLEAEVSRLQQASDSELEAVNEAVAQVKRPAAPPVC